MVFVRYQLNHFGFQIFLLILFVGLVITLGRVIINLTPEQVTWLSARLPGGDNSYDHTITLPGKYELSTQSNSSQFQLQSQSAKKVAADLAGFDIFLSEQPFRTPDNLDFPAEDKPSHLIINLVDEPQRYFALYDEASDTDLGSLDVVKRYDQIELNIHLPVRESPEIVSWHVTKLILYGLYALTHNWPDNEVAMISQINEQFVAYYGHEENPPTFYVE